MPRPKKVVAEVEVKPITPSLYSVVLHITEPMLGTAPSNPQIYADFVASKKFANQKKVATTLEEKAAINELETALIKEELAQLPEDNEKGITVFRRNKGGLILTDTMVRGFLKEGAGAMGDGNGKTWGLTSKIDRWIFVTDEHAQPIREVPILRDGVQIKEPDSIFERPLRAMTAQGPRITLAASEQVNPVSSIHVHLFVLPLGVSKGGISAKVLTDWLNYGIYTGLGQYRTGGYGRFAATIVAKEGTLTPEISA